MENKKLFIVKKIVSDDNGNLYCDTEVFVDEKDSIEYIIKLHNEVYEDMVHYDSNEDEYEVEDDWDESRPQSGFIMYLDHWIEYKVIVSLEIKEILI